MLAQRYDIAEIKARRLEGDPLIVTKSNARKAFFHKINRNGGENAFGGRRSIRSRNNGLMRRGNSFAGNRFGQRVVIKISSTKNRTKGIGTGEHSGAKNLYHHVKYISRLKAGEEGEKAYLFNQKQDEVDGLEFHGLCKDDRHHFRMIISPEHGSEMDDFKGYVRKVMKHVSRDLDTKLDWVSAVHYDTDDVHAHVIIRGKRDNGEDLVMGRDFISFGIRARAQEVATELLGERSLDEIQKAMEKEVDALRVTSLDRFIEKQTNEERIIDVRKDNNFGKSTHFEGLIKGRLRYLQTSGLAYEHPPGIYTMQENYKDVLAKIATRNDVIKKLYGKVNGLEDISVYSLEYGEGKDVSGRIVAKGSMDEVTDRKYIVVKDMSEELHYVPVGEARLYDDLEKGSLVKIGAGDKATGRSDYNISSIAKDNDGVYDPAKHREYVEEHMKYIEGDDIDSYLESHKKRLDTLEKNEVVESIGDDKYKIPEDVIEKGEEVTRQINEREKKRFYPRLNVLSKKPVEKLVNSAKKTWLDKEIFKQSKGKQSVDRYDSNITDAIEKRKDWLIKHDLGLIQSNGEFALRKDALSRLDMLEVHLAAERFAKKRNLVFKDRRVKEGEEMTYHGYVRLEAGTWAVVSKGNDLHMAKLGAIPDVKLGQQINFEALEKNKFEIKVVEKSKQLSKNKEREQDNEMEL